MNHRFVAPAALAALLAAGSEGRAAALPQEEAVVAEEAPAAVGLNDEDAALFGLMRVEGRFEEALAALREHAAWKSGDTRARALEGLILVDLGQDDEAEKILAPYRFVKLSEPDMLMLLAHDNLQRKETQKAQGKYTLALHYSKGSAEARLGMLSCAILLEGNLKSADDLLAMQGQSAELPAGMFERIAGDACLAAATQRMNDGDYGEETLGILERARQAAPANPQVLLAAADVRVRRGDHDQAIVLLDELADKHPEEMQHIQCLRAASQEARGLLEEALESAVDSITISGRKNIGALETACRIEFALGRLNEMRIHMDRLRELSNSVETFRISSLYFVERAKQAEAKGDQGTRDAHLHSAYDSCRRLHVLDAFHVENLERLLWVCEQLGPKSDLTLDDVRRKLEVARLKQKRLQEQDKGG
ncbi:MAG: tetratricopeptide repeat protein [Planctomycetes bacterium]|nr:tetratricopeptide repeat protein [Planctomycetota bacterium]